MKPPRQILPAVKRRVLGPYRTLARLDARLYDLQSRLTRVEEIMAASASAAAQAELSARAELLVGLTDETRALTAATHRLLSGEIRGVLRALVADESANRRRLHCLRADEDYGAAWDEPRPLVTVTVATRNRPAVLAERSLPSILGQTYSDLEVIVVGDHEDAASGDAVRAFDDDRITYRNLTQRLQFTDEPWRRWLVGATMARNEAMRLARGRWVVCFDDDDSLRPDCIERLLERAREQRLEAVYGRAVIRRGRERDIEIGVFPPELGQFTWASGMYHAGLRFLEREIFAADLGVPGDWFLAERMLRAGVRFGMIDAVLCDLYPSPRDFVVPADERDSIDRTASPR